jgi:glyoxylase-like metal-dependent hydrolase (beta-lactamase superfamily II)
MCTLRRICRCLLFACVITSVDLGAQAPPKTVSIHHFDTADILYVLEGGGENALVLAHDAGVVLIDPLPARWGKASLEAIASVTDRPVKVIVNIRDSEEHLKANAEYPTATRIIAHRNLAARAKNMAAFAGAGAKFLPNEIVTDRLTLLDGVDRMDLAYFGPGRTDADLVVIFPMKGVVYLGNLFPSKAVPIIEKERGGSALVFPETLAKVRALTGIRTAVPGREPPAVRQHGAQKPGAVMPLSTVPPWRQFEEYVDFTRELVAAVVQAKQAGKAAPQDAVSGLALSDRFKLYDMRGAAALAAVVYAELPR